MKLENICKGISKAIKIGAITAFLAAPAYSLTNCPPPDQNGYSSGYPDLTIAEAFVCPGTVGCFNENKPKAGENLVVTFVIKNEGDETTSEDIEYKINTYSAEDNIEVDTGVKLAPGKIMRVHAKYNYATAGIYNPVITIDPYNKIAECNEDNNERTLSTIVE